MFATNCMTRLGQLSIDALPKRAEELMQDEVASRSARRCPSKSTKLNTISGTSESSVVYARLMARTPMSPASQSRTMAAG